MASTASTRASSVPHSASRAPLQGNRSASQAGQRRRCGPAVSNQGLAGSRMGACFRGRWRQARRQAPMRVSQVQALVLVLALVSKRPPPQAPGSRWAPG